MAAQTDPNFGLAHSWDNGENGWDTGMNANLKKIGALFFLSVKNRTTTTIPNTPSAGDRYIIPSSGASWGAANQVAIYANGGWLYYTPARGWLAWVENESAFYKFNGTAWSKLQEGLTEYTIADITNLQTTLNNKADVSHNHNSDYAAVNHTHSIANVTGLQTSLDGKAATSHAHIVADVTGLQATLDAKAAASHTHTISDTTGLQTALDAKAAASHAHAISDVTGLQGALDAKANTASLAAVATSGSINDVSGKSFPVSVYIFDKPGASEIVLRWVADRAGSFSAQSNGANAPAKAATAATGSNRDFAVRKNGVQFGTIRFDSATNSGTTGVFQSFSSSSFVAGDVLDIVAPSTQDGGLASIAITLTFNY